MTTHDSRSGTARKVGRFLWHYAEMAIAMVVGMVLLGLLWSVFLPDDLRTDVDTLIMAANMTIGMAVWMLVRRHGWASIAEMSLAMFVPFLVLLVPFWLGVLSGHLVMVLGHVLMFVAMALAMLRRRDEYINHRHKLRLRPKWIWRAAVVLIALAVPGAVSAVNTVERFGAIYEPRADTVTVAPAPKADRHDPAKPTVAFLASGSGTNAADLLGPYEVLAGTGRVNTYVVSAGARLVPLTGGLDLVPDVTFDELARLLVERGDTLEAVVVPAIYDLEPAERGVINTWLRQQSAAGALSVSVCYGAHTLAGSGLLDGRTATTHWNRLSEVRADYGAVNWISGQRFVDLGNVITTAGALSGIDGGLRIIERLLDDATAREAASRVGYRYYSPGASAAIPESTWAPSDVVVALNSSYQTGPSTIGVRLLDGTGELELASVFNSYTEQSLVGRTIAVGDGPIRSRHGLTFVPRSTLAAVAGDLDRLLVPGLARPPADPAGPAPEYLHTGEEFAFDPVLRDIASTYDVAIARFAGKTLEYPVMDVELTGDSWPWAETVVPVLLALLGAALAIAAGMIVRRIRRGRAHDRSVPKPPADDVENAEASQPAPAGVPDH